MKRPLGKSTRSSKVNRHCSVHEARLILRSLLEQKDAKFYTWFYLHTLLDLRVCESTSVNLADFSTDMCHLRYRCAKTDDLGEKYIPEPLRRQLIAYIRENAKEIYAGGGWLFYSFNHQSKEKHIGVQRA